jgi:hypothetical protein
MVVFCNIIVPPKLEETQGKGKGNKMEKIWHDAMVAD